MRRSSWRRDTGSALIEAVAIGSVVFLAVVAAVSATIELGLRGSAAEQAARSSAVHAARHADLVAAEDMAGRGGDATRDGDTIRVVVVTGAGLPHPDGTAWTSIIGRSAMPLAPFRSDRG